MEMTKTRLSMLTSVCGQTWFATRLFPTWIGILSSSIDKETPEQQAKEAAEDTKQEK